MESWTFSREEIASLSPALWQELQRKVRQARAMAPPPVPQAPNPRPTASGKRARMEDVGVVKRAKEYPQGHILHRPTSSHPDEDMVPVKARVPDEAMATMSAKRSEASTVQESPRPTSPEPDEDMAMTTAKRPRTHDEPSTAVKRHRESPRPTSPEPDEDMAMTSAKRPRTHDDVKRHRDWLLGDPDQDKRTAVEEAPALAPEPDEEMPFDHPKAKVVLLEGTDRCLRCQSSERDCVVHAAGYAALEPWADQNCKKAGAEFCHFEPTARILGPGFLQQHAKDPNVVYPIPAKAKPATPAPAASEKDKVPMPAPASAPGSARKSTSKAYVPTDPELLARIDVAFRGVAYAYTRVEQGVRQRTFCIPCNPSPSPMLSSLQAQREAALALRQQEDDELRQKQLPREAQLPNASLETKLYFERILERKMQHTMDSGSNYSPPSTDDESTTPPRKRKRKRKPTQARDLKAMEAMFTRLQEYLDQIVIKLSQIADAQLALSTLIVLSPIMSGLSARIALRDATRREADAQMRALLNRTISTDCRGLEGEVVVASHGHAVCRLTCPIPSPSPPLPNLAPMVDFEAEEAAAHSASEAPSEGEGIDLEMASDAGGSDGDVVLEATSSLRCLACIRANAACWVNGANLVALTEWTHSPMPRRPPNTTCARCQTKKERCTPRAKRTPEQWCTEHMAWLCKQERRLDELAERLTESDHLTLVARFTAYNELRMMFPENTPYPPEFAPLLTPTDRLQHVPAGVLPTLSPEKQARLDALSREYGLDDALAPWPPLPARRVLAERAQKAQRDPTRDIGQATRPGMMESSSDEDGLYHPGRAGPSSEPIRRKARPRRGTAPARTTVVPPPTAPSYEDVAAKIAEVQVKQTHLERLAWLILDNIKGRPLALRGSLPPAMSSQAPPYTRTQFNEVSAAHGMGPDDAGAMLRREKKALLLETMAQLDREDEEAKLKAQAARWHQPPPAPPPASVPSQSSMSPTPPAPPPIFSQTPWAGEASPWGAQPSQGKGKQKAVSFPDAPPPPPSAADPAHARSSRRNGKARAILIIRLISDL
ncbi:hypothetical protein BJ912DRAFT_927492 [Pholiota molesta]|nr:hypothetical protein BJ912DRAFT_927492 [Pholiota molesta]